MIKSKVFAEIGILLVISACTNAREEAAEEILARPEVRSELFGQIVASDKYTAEFARIMAGSENAVREFLSYPAVLRAAWQSEKMDSLLRTDQAMMETVMERVVSKMGSDTNTCSMMCGKVMENPRLKAYVIAHACGKAEEKTTKTQK